MIPEPNPRRGIDEIRLGCDLLPRHDLGQSGSERRLRVGRPCPACPLLLDTVMSLQEIPEPTEALLPCPNACFPWLPEHRLAVVGDLQDSRGGATEFVAGCRDCDLFTDQQRTREEAIAAWNTREPEAPMLTEAEEAELVERINASPNLHPLPEPEADKLREALEAELKMAMLAFRRVVQGGLGTKAVREIALARAHQISELLGCEKHGAAFISPGICPFCDEESRNQGR
jgi:hypothetical protein